MDNKLSIHGHISQELSPSKFIGELVKEVFLNSGVSLTGDREEFYNAAVKGLIEEFKGQFKNLTPDDVRLAFKRGVKGEYGEYMGVNYKSLYHFLHCYTRQKNLDESLKNIFEKEEKQRQIEQEQYTSKMFLEDQYKAFKEGNEVIWGIGDLLYDKLIQLGVKQPDEVELNAYMDKARSELLNEAETQAYSCNSFERANIMEFVKSLRAGVGGDEVIKRAKTLIARRIFEKRLAREEKEEK